MMWDTKKTLKIWKRTSADIFRYEILKVAPLIVSELFNRSLLIVHPPLFFSFVIALAKPTQPSSTMLRDNVCPHSLTLPPTLLLFYRGLRFVKNHGKGDKYFPVKMRGNPVEKEDRNLLHTIVSTEMLVWKSLVLFFLLYYRLLNLYTERLKAHHNKVMVYTADIE